MGLVYVTHRPREIGFDLDAVLVLDQGRVVCRGGPGACL
jgi:ABC-type multidrug transport system fused ATPase/permease subunit